MRAWRAISLLASFCFTAGWCAADDETSETALMIQSQIEARGVKDRRVLEAMRLVDRREFVDKELTGQANADFPLPIGYGQTISQPYIVAVMTEAAQIKPFDRVLEIGTGSGYQAAILGELAFEVYTIEIVRPLAEQAAKRLKRLGYWNVHPKHGDGYAGWPEQAPFDAIVVTAAPPKVPEKLIEQLAPGGRLVIPVGESDQNLLLIQKTARGVVQKTLLPVRFVPMVPEAAQA